MRIFSSSPRFFRSVCDVSASAIDCEAWSVTSELITQVKRIMITTPLSMLVSTRYSPGPVESFIPTITMAMDPAACAEVSPNIILPYAQGRLNTALEIYAAIALPKVPKKMMQKMMNAVCHP